MASCKENVRRSVSREGGTSGGANMITVVGAGEGNRSAQIDITGTMVPLSHSLTCDGRLDAFKPQVGEHLPEGFERIYRGLGIRYRSEPNRISTLTICE